MNDGDPKEMHLGTRDVIETGRLVDCNLKSILRYGPLFYLKQVILASLVGCYVVSDIFILSLKLLLNILVRKWHRLKVKNVKLG